MRKKEVDRKMCDVWRENDTNYRFQGLGRKKNVI